MSALQYSNCSKDTTYARGGHGRRNFLMDSPPSSYETSMSTHVTCVKKLSEGATACLFHLPLQAFVTAIMKLKARAGIIFRNCEKSLGPPRTGDKSVIQNK